MSLVDCDITDIEMDGSNGYPVASVLAECRICGFVTSSYGTSEASIRRCLAMMREECPRRQRNYYREAS